MSATRKAIRQAIKSVLLNNTAAGASVFASRCRPVWKNELPAILVYANEENVTVFNQSPRELQRVLSVGIEIAAAADEALDDTLDDIAQQVERIMSENQTLGEIASDIVLTRAEVKIVADGENQHGACTLSYDVTYYTLDVSEGVEGDGVPDTNVLRTFETAGAEWKVPPFAAGQPEAKDEVSLPQT